MSIGEGFRFPDLTQTFFALAKMPTIEATRSYLSEAFQTMGIPDDPLLDIMRRSLINLDFIDANHQAHSLYEVTQLVNSFLGAFIHPFEKSARGKEFIRHFRERPPPVPFESGTARDLDYLEFIYFVRHALAHGDLHYNANKIRQIESITLWNTKNKEKPLRLTLSIRNMKLLLIDFAKISSRSVANSTHPEGRRIVIFHNMTGRNFVDRQGYFFHIRPLLEMNSQRNEVGKFIITISHLCDDAC